MKTAKAASTPPFKKLLGQGQDISPFEELCAALLTTRECPPVVTIQKKNGKMKKRGDILNFIRGLRLSARLIYILRDKLSDHDVEVNWGHVEDDRQRLCSPECDIIIHDGGVADRWNGRNQHCVMDFLFIKREAVKAIISCKSALTGSGIDTDFAAVVKRDFKIHNTFLFAETVQDSKYASLNKKAKAAGYKGLWTLYRLDSTGGRIKNPQDYLDFLNAVRRAI
jgi:hypothetical protein